jgi:Xaa-Pro aminopeptidase
MGGDGLELAFTEAEFDRRLAGTRAGMSERGLDLLLVFTPENVSYLTGYETIGYSSFLCLLVPREGTPRMIVREMELDVAHATTWLSEFATVSDTQDPIEIASGIVAELARSGAAVGVEETSPFVSARTWRGVVDSLTRIGAQPVDGSGLVEPVRRVKSDEELVLIREACDLAVAGMDAAVNAVQSGVTENQVASVAFTAMVDGGSDFLSGGPIVTSGVRGSIAHTTFGNRTILDGDAVLVELGGCRRRYGGALMRTVGVGGGGDRFSELATVLDEALDAAIAAIAPGRTCGSVDAACRTHIEGAGLGRWFRKRTGYSMGVAFAPDWGEGHIASMRDGDDMVLEPGMAFHLPPAVRLPGETVYGVSETIVVTANGCDVLTDFPRRLMR